MKSTSEIMLLAGTGVNIIIDARTKSISEIIIIVGAVGRKNGRITLKNCDTKSVSELLMICRNYPDCITLDLTNS
jgi:hypothetical protein